MEMPLPRPAVALDHVLDDPGLVRRLAEANAPYAPVQRYFANLQEQQALGGPGAKREPAGTDSGGALFVAPVFRGDWAYDRPLVEGVELLLHNAHFVEAARSLGVSDVRVMARHILPNALAPVLVSMSFGVASAILAESGLSFLGIGVPAHLVTWGSILSEARANTFAWWLAVFPGFAIFLTVTVYNLLGDGLRDALDPKS